MNGDEQVGIDLARFLAAGQQGDFHIGGARHVDDVALGFQLGLGSQRHGKGHVFLLHAAGADGAGVNAAMPRVEHNHGFARAAVGLGCRLLLCGGRGLLLNQ